MDYDRVDAVTFGQALTGLTVNLLVPSVAREAEFLAGVFGLGLHQPSGDFAIVRYGAQTFQLHADGTYAAHPLHALLPAPPRGLGIELRLHETDPDAAVARLPDHPDAVLLQPPTDKTAHGLREAVILSPAGYAWVPSRRL